MHRNASPSDYLKCVSHWRGEDDEGKESVFVSGQRHWKTVVEKALFERMWGLRRSGRSGRMEWLYPDGNHE